MISARTAPRTRRGWRLFFGGLAMTAAITTAVIVTGAIVASAQTQGATEWFQSMGITRINSSCNTGSALQQRIVNIAKGELGTTDDAHNCNICDQWCAEFATWVWHSAGVNIPVMASVPAVYEWATAHGKWSGTSELTRAVPGDLIIFGTAKDRDHIGVVDHVSGHTVYVISGNTPAPLTAGDGVFDKSYSLSGAVFYGLVHL